MDYPLPGLTGKKHRLVLRVRGGCKCRRSLPVCRELEAVFGSARHNGRSKASVLRGIRNTRGHDYINTKILISAFGVIAISSYAWS